MGLWLEQATDKESPKHLCFIGLPVAFILSGEGFNLKKYPVRVFLQLPRLNCSCRVAFV